MFANCWRLQERFDKEAMEWGDSPEPLEDDAMSE
jgi:hypothetical protein